jgi:plasmid stabilization system protein ParE
MAGFRIPTTDHPARDAMGDLAHIAEVLDRRNVERLPDFAEAIRSARRTIAATPAARAVNIICLRADDERWLISVGPRGGWRRVWNFGTGRD